MQTWGGRLSFNWVRQRVLQPDTWFIPASRLLLRLWPLTSTWQILSLVKYPIALKNRTHLSTSGNEISRLRCLVSLSSSFCLMDHFPVDSLLEEINVTTFPLLWTELQSVSGQLGLAQLSQDVGNRKTPLRTYQTLTASRCVCVMKMHGEVKKAVVLIAVRLFVLLLSRSRLYFFPLYEVLSVTRCILCIKVHFTVCNKMLWCKNQLQKTHFEGQSVRVQLKMIFIIIYCQLFSFDQLFWL